MRTVEVPQKEWAHALNEFSTTHEGSLISLDILAPTLGAQPQIRELPLRGVTAETTPRGSAIMISAAQGDGEQVTHVIPSPTHVRIEQTNEGADLALQVESVEGVTVILRFKAAAPSASVDETARPS